jgi:hypothetical protein
MIAKNRNERKAQHAPGPWEVADQMDPRARGSDWTHREVVTFTNVPRTEEIPSGIAVVISPHQEVYGAEWEAQNLAHAYLVSAAPDLLAACRGVRDALALAAALSPETSPLRRALEHMDAAIIKAEGGTR